MAGNRPTRRSNYGSPSYSDHSYQPHAGQQHVSKGSSTLFNSNLMTNSYHINDQQRGDHFQNPPQHHRGHPARSNLHYNSLSPNHIRSAQASNGNNNMNESPSDSNVQSYAGGHPTKKRKQDGSEEPMENSCDSLAYTTTRDTNYHPNTKISSAPLTKVTDDARRFAQTRYPFPPFILHFKAAKIKDKEIIENLLKYGKMVYSFDLELAGYRTSNVRCKDNECNLMIFVKNSASFSFLYSDIKWPDSLGDQSFTIERQPMIPPQLAIIINNVSYKMNMDEFEHGIKSRYDNVFKVVRLKNKDQYDTKMVKVEFSSYKPRDDILKNKGIIVDNINYEVREYLPQATILICSKCWRLGHFRKQCKQIEESCKVCSERCNDMNKHNCTGVVKCLQCGGDHNSNDMKCKVIKQYRADLTKTLLSAASTSLNKNLPASSEFPSLPGTQRRWADDYNSSTDVQFGMMRKLDQILSSMNNINNALGDLTQRTEYMEQWLKDKRKLEEKTDNEIKTLQLAKIRHEGELLRHANVVEKLILPVLDDILSVLVEVNIKDGRNMNIDFTSRSEIWKNECKAYIEKRLKFQ